MTINWKLPKYLDSELNWAETPPNVNPTNNQAKSWLGPSDENEEDEDDGADGDEDDGVDEDDRNTCEGQISLGSLAGSTSVTRNLSIKNTNTL